MDNICFVYFTIFIVGFTLPQEILSNNNKAGMLEKEVPHYRYCPERYLVKDNVKCVYRDEAIITDRTVQHNKPDITIIGKKRILCDINDIGNHLLPKKIENIHI